MSISQKINLLYKNQVESIKNMKNGAEKDRAIGALVTDLGIRSINAVKNALKLSWRKTRKMNNKNF